MRLGEQTTIVWSCQSPLSGAKSIHENGNPVDVGCIWVMNAEDFIVTGSVRGGLAWTSES
jgi:hypothetical protein